MTPESYFPNFLVSRLCKAEALITEASKEDFLPYLLLKSTGRKIRASLVLASSSIYGDEPSGSEEIAAALEIIHLASLIHDDIIDGSPIRRGMPSAVAQLGASKAVLTGDLLLSKAFSLLSLHGVPQQIAIITDATLQMSRSQIRELQIPNLSNIAIDQYMEIISGKTASLIEAACHAGSLCAHAEPSHIEALRNYGHNFGIAYQLYDDYLDIWGDEKEMGKPILTDLYEGRSTLPILLALKDEKTSKALQSIISKIVSAKQSGKELDFYSLLAELRDMLSREKIPQRISEITGNFTKKAIKALNGLPDSLANQFLQNFPQTVIKFAL